MIYGEHLLFFGVWNRLLWLGTEAEGVSTTPASRERLDFEPGRLPWVERDTSVTACHYQMKEHILREAS